jgi:hypothetical protein
MSKAFKVLVASILSVASMAVWSGTAGATSMVAAYRPIAQHVCANSGAGRCIQHTSGGLTTTAQGNVGADDDFTAIGTTVCGSGQVTSSCPNLPPGQNSNFLHDLIVCMNSSAGGYMKSNGGGNFVTIESVCNGNDNYWIIDNATFVNVGDTIGGGVPRYLTRQANDHVVDMGGITSNTKWGPCSSC